MKDKKKLIAIIVAIVAVIGIVIGVLFATGTIGSGGSGDEDTTQLGQTGDSSDVQGGSSVSDTEFLSAEDMPKHSSKFDQSTVQCQVDMGKYADLTFQAPKDLVDEDNFEFVTCATQVLSNSVILDLSYQNDSQYVNITAYYSSQEFTEDNYLGAVVETGELDSTTFTINIFNEKHKVVANCDNNLTDDLYEYTLKTTTGLKIVGVTDYNTDTNVETYYYNDEEITKEEGIEKYVETDPIIDIVYNS